MKKINSKKFNRPSPHSFQILWAIPRSQKRNRFQIGNSSKRSTSNVTHRIKHKFKVRVKVKVAGFNEPHLRRSIASSVSYVALLFFLLRLVKCVKSSGCFSATNSTCAITWISANRLNLSKRLFTGFFS